MQEGFVVFYMVVCFFLGLFGGYAIGLLSRSQ